MMSKASSSLAFTAGLFVSMVTASVYGDVTPAKRTAAKAPEKRTITIEPATLAKAPVFTDGKSHYLFVIPDERSTVRLFYGDGKRFSRVPIEAGGMAPGWDFQDPRFFNKTANPNFRGIDWRVMGAAEQSKDGSKLDVRCGERHATFTRLPDPGALSLLSSASFEQTLRRWRPYAMARDNGGVYYYVDRGYDEEDTSRPKNFRLFVGQRGSLKQQKMTNVVSDSEGDIFSTKSGDLRLVLNRSESEWVESGKSRKLLWVDPAQNLHMIFTDLGVYTDERLGTPCDDL